MRTARVALAAVVLLTLGACSSGGGTSGGAAGTAGTAATSAGTAATSAGADATSPSPSAATGSAEVKIATTALGDVLVDAAGMTLYMYEPDNQGASTCYGQCAAAWPPLVSAGVPTVGAGADDSKVGTAARTDGALQVTYGGWPVYYFAKDAAPGDTTGQGVGGVWWVLDADGQPIRG